jgi:hypothetical protein
VKQVPVPTTNSLIRQRPECSKQNVSLLLTRQFGKISQCPDLLHGRTFSVAPHPFKQLYTIRVPFKDVTGTAVYAFLPNKCQDTYRELFQYLVDNYHASNLQFNIQTDFEDAVFRAVTAVFGRPINHQDCFYHLTQASWRKVHQPGLVPLYKNDDDFRLFCGMMDGLAFSPVPDLTNGIHLPC